MGKKNHLNQPLLLRVSTQSELEMKPPNLLAQLSSSINSAAQEEKERTFERVEQEMEIFQVRKGEYSRFQVSLCIANELGKWAGASDQEKGKAFDSYLAEINTVLAVQDENRSMTRETSPPPGTSHQPNQCPTGKRI